MIWIEFDCIIVVAYICCKWWNTMAAIFWTTVSMVIILFLFPITAILVFFNAIVHLLVVSYQVLLLLFILRILFFIYFNVFLMRLWKSFMAVFFAVWMWTFHTFVVFKIILIFCLRWTAFVVTVLDSIFHLCKIELSQLNELNQQLFYLSKNWTCLSEP